MTDTWNLTDIEPAHDLVAELAVLSCLLTAPSSADDVWRIISPADFYKPLYAITAEILAGLTVIDPNAAVAQARKLERTDVLQLLPQLIDRPVISEHARFYAEQVLAASRRRQLQRLAVRTLQQASNEATDVDQTTVGLMVEAEGILDGRPREITPPVDIEDFLAGEDHYDWVIPNFLERGDRIILTGGEGAGKSTLTRQIAVCSASGIHPITGAKMPPLRVLLVDLENGRMHLRRKLRILVNYLRTIGDLDRDRLRIEHRPEGIDLGSLSDVAWLTDKVMAARPDLLIIAPLYKLHTAALDKEDAARAITHTLDGIRMKARCALLIEAHAPHGITGARGWRPQGSSLFMRWPEFGFGLKPNNRDGSVTVKHWRGPRDERAWPARFVRSNSDTALPWLEDAPDENEDAWSA